jgi:hypothetical protein
MWKKFKWDMFVTSFIPLWLSIIVIDIDTFKSLASQYKSSRTFITLKPERINRIKNKRSRKSVADMLHLPLDTNGNFAITTAEEASLLIRYLCFKIFQDNETKDVLEANTVTKLSIA